MSADVLVLFAGGTVGLNVRFVSFARLSVFFCFLLQKNQVMIALPKKSKKIMIFVGREKRTNARTQSIKSPTGGQATSCLLTA